MQRPGVVYLHLLPAPESLSAAASGGDLHPASPAAAAPPAPEILATLGLLVLPPAAAAEVQDLYGRMVQEAAEAAAEAGTAAGGVLLPAAVQGPSDAVQALAAAAPAAAAAQQCAYWGYFSSFLASWSLLLSPSAAQWQLQAARADSPLARQQGAELSAAAAEEAQSLLPFLLAQRMMHCVEVRLTWQQLGDLPCSGTACQAEWWCATPARN
jgi:hypothetical protein